MALSGRAPASHSAYTHSPTEIELATSLLLHAQGHPASREHQSLPSPEQALHSQDLGTAPADRAITSTSLSKEDHEHGTEQPKAEPNPIADHEPSPSFPVDASSHVQDTTMLSGQVCSNCRTTTTPLWRRTLAGETICNACGLYLKARNQMRPVSLKRVPYNTPQAPAANPGRGHSAGPAITHAGADSLASCHSNGTCPGGGRCNGTGGQEGCNGCPAYNNRVSKTAQMAAMAAAVQVQPLSANRAQQEPPRRAQYTADGIDTDGAVVACQNCHTTVTPLWRRDDNGHNICNACGTCRI